MVSENLCILCWEVTQLCIKNPENRILVRSTWHTYLVEESDCYAIHPARSYRTTQDFSWKFETTKYREDNNLLCGQNKLEL